MTLVEKNPIHDVDTKCEEENSVRRTGRWLSLRRTKLYPLAAAALLVALIMIIREISLVLRYDSDRETTSETVTNEWSMNEIVADLDRQQQLQAQQRPVNWTRLHLAEKQKTQRELHVLKRKLQSRFTRLTKDDEILSYKQLARQFRPLLRKRGLLVVGDSSSRLIFVTLWCLMDGFFPSDEDRDGSVCHNRQKELKEKCQALTNLGRQCDHLATFSDGKSSLHLQFQRNWLIETIQHNIVEAIGSNRDRFILYMVPCLHSLWMPGGREVDIHNAYPNWTSNFNDFYSSLEESNPAHSLLLGTTVTVCDSKLWERPLVEMYLQGKNFINGEPRHEFNLYTYQGRANLSAKYSGPVPVLKSFRENHTCDNSLFDEGGVLKCTAVGLEVLSQHSLLTNPTVKILDMHDATKDGCNDTLDGRHYLRGLTLRRQLTLLLKAMQMDAIVEDDAA